VLCTCAAGGSGLRMSGFGENCSRCASMKGAMFLLGTRLGSVDNPGYVYSIPG